MTVPPACPQCKGSGLRFEWLGYDPLKMPTRPYWWMWERVGYLRVPCPLCNVRGTLVSDEPPSSDPSTWEYRLPEEVKQARKEIDQAS